MQKIFKVQEAYSGDAMKGLARIHPDDMAALNLNEGDLIEIIGKKNNSRKSQSRRS